MLAPIHPYMATSRAVVTQEHTNDARDLFITSSHPKQFPYTIPLSGTAATLNPLSSPPVGGTSLEPYGVSLVALFALHTRYVSCGGLLARTEELTCIPP
jgi:hypothetical protein